LGTGKVQRLDDGVSVWRSLVAFHVQGDALSTIASTQKGPS